MKEEPEKLDLSIIKEKPAKKQLQTKTIPSQSTTIEQIP